MNPAGFDGAIYGNIAQLGKQWAGILAAWGWAFGITSLLAWFVNAVIGLRPTEAEETTGMDITQHKEIAYHYYETEQA